MTSEPPRLHYRSEPHEEAEQEEVKKEASPQSLVINRVFTVLTWAILLVVLVLWAVLGAIFWIPLLIRAMIRFTISLVEAVFEGHKPARAAGILRNAVSFYRRGFVIAVEVVTKEEIDPREEGRVMENRLLWEFLWALLVWYFIFLAFGWISASPLDFLDWFLSIPWADHLRGLVDRVTA